MALPSEAEITVKFADGTVLHYPAVTDVTTEVKWYEDDSWLSNRERIWLQERPIHILSFRPQGEYTITAPPELTKAERRAALIREMYPTK